MKLLTGSWWEQTELENWGVSSMSKSKLNYWVDVCIGIAFIGSAISGLVFLLPVGSPSALGISYRTWDSVHTWSSLAMIAGVGGHLMLHWKWLVTMTRRMFAPKRTSVSVPATAAASTVTRRRFLRLGLGAAAAAVVGYVALSASGGAEGEAGAEEAGTAGGDSLAASGSSSLQDGSGYVAEELGDGQSRAPEDTSPRQEPAPEQTERPAPQEEGEPDGSADVQQAAEPSPERVEPDPTPTDTPEQQELGVACPFGMVNDPSPGRCRRYTDADGDGICDHSVLGSGPYSPRA